MKLFTVKISLIAILLSAASIFAGQYRFSRTLSFDSAYFPSMISNRGFWQFGLEFEGLGSGVFDYVDENLFVGENPITRLAWGAATYFLWPKVQEAYFVSNHELGHGARVASVGGIPYYVWDSKGNPHNSIFMFFIEGLTTSGGAYTASSGGTSSVAPPDSWLNSVIAGGMNNSSMFAEALEDQMATNGGHVMEYMAYVRAKEDAYNYARGTELGGAFGGGGIGDVQNLLNDYSSRGIGITTNDIKVGSQVSRWLSSSHWAYGIGAVKYVFSGDPNVHPLSLGPIKMPDISHFLMYRGLSFKLRTAILNDSVQYPFELEYLYKGEKIIEASLGYRELRRVAGIRNGVMWVQGYFNSLGALGVKLQRDSKIGEKATASLGASLYQSNLLEGQRNISKFSSTNLGYELWGRISLTL